MSKTSEENYGINNNTTSSRRQEISIPLPLLVQDPTGRAFSELSQAAEPPDGSSSTTDLTDWVWFSGTVIIRPSPSDPFPSITLSPRSTHKGSKKLPVHSSTRVDTHSRRTQHPRFNLQPPITRSG